MNGTNVGCADSWMRAGVVRQVDQFGGFAHSVKDRFGHGFRFPGERDHRAVVIRVAFTVEHQDARHAAHSVDERVHLGRVAPFGEILARIRSGVS